MAYQNTSTFLALFLISNILLATTWQAVVGRNIPKNTKTQDKKEPQWLFHSDGRVYIPGIGRVVLPPKYKLTPHCPYAGGNGGAGSPFTGKRGGAGSPYTGGSGGAGSGPSGHSYVPGGDDTFVPNPGFEVPNPGFEVPNPASGGGVPAAAHP